LCSDVGDDRRRTSDCLNSSIRNYDGESSIGISVHALNWSGHVR
jgi:hypothetical protein